MIANAEEDEVAEASKYGFLRPAFSISLSDGASAEIRKYMTFHRLGDGKESKKMGYSIHVRGFKDAQRVKDDVEALLILASLASRERSLFWHWSTEENSVRHRHWRFGTPKFPSRKDHIEPLLPRNHADCSKFLPIAFRNYLNSQNTELLNAAVYALMSRDLPLEVQIVRLFSAIQSALLFSLQEPSKPKRLGIRFLYEKFEKKYAPDFSDLWPLLSAPSGDSLYEFRNAAVHGEVFTEDDWLALSYAAENLQWILERIILISLGWDVAVSAVSPLGLKNYCAYHWQKEQQHSRLRSEKKPPKNRAFRG